MRSLSDEAAGAAEAQQLALENLLCEIARSTFSQVEVSDE